MKIQIYTKDYCQFCLRAKEVFAREGWEYEEIDITQDPAAFAELKKRSKLMTVPQIFVGDEFIGGYTDLVAKIKDVREMMAN